MIPADKINHILAGLIAGFVTAALACPWWAPLAVSTALGVAKEVFDWAWNRWVRPGHSVEALDALATAAGGLMVSLYLLWS